MLSNNRHLSLNKKLRLLMFGLLLVLIPLRYTLAVEEPARRGTPPPAATEKTDTGTKDDGADASSIDTSAGLKDVGRSATGKEIGISSVGNPYGLAARIISAIIGLVGVIFFVLMVYAGFLWMTGGGNEERVRKAQGIFGSSLVGLLIILTAYYLVDFVFALLQESLSV
jgi:hypothetical protein